MVVVPCWLINLLNYYGSLNAQNSDQNLMKLCSSICMIEMEENYYLQYLAFRKWKEKSSGTIVNDLRCFTFRAGKEKLLKNFGEFNQLNDSVSFSACSQKCSWLIQWKCSKSDICHGYFDLANESYIIINLPLSTCLWQ